MLLRAYSIFVICLEVDRKSDPHPEIVGRKMIIIATIVQKHMDHLGIVIVNESSANKDDIAKKILENREMVTVVIALIVASVNMIGSVSEIANVIDVEASRVIEDVVGRETNDAVGHETSVAVVHETDVEVRRVTGGAADRRSVERGR